MSDHIFFDGIKYVSASDAADSNSLSRDYVAKLCREAKVAGKRVGKNWYVSDTSLKEFLMAQEYHRSRRRESLVEERTREYHQLNRFSDAPVKEVVPSITHEKARTFLAKAASVKKEVKKAAEAVAEKSPIQISVPEAVKELPVSAHVSAMRETVSRAAAKHGQMLTLAARDLAHAGLPDAAIRSVAHIPLYSVTPLGELMHKAVALTLAIMMTFGTYAFVDPQFARFAMTSARESITGLVDSYEQLTGGGLSHLADRTETKVKVAVENPSRSLAAAASFFPETLSNFAKAFNAQVDNLVYAVAFPSGLVDREDTSGSVAVEIQPYARTSSRQPIADIQQPITNTQQESVGSRPLAVSSQGSTPVVIERVIETRTVAEAGGLTDEYLTEKLNQLENKLSSQMYALSSANSTAIVQNYGVTAQTNTINNLSRVGIHDSTIEGGTIAGAEISGGSIRNASITSSAVAATTLSSSEETSLATTTVRGDLTLNGGLTMTGTSSSAGITATYATVTNLTATNATSTNFFATLAQVTTGVIDTFSSTLSTIFGLTVTNSTTTNATSTNLYTSVFEAVNASTTDLTFQRAVGGSATTTNFFATTASSTNLFAQNAGLGALSAGTLNVTGDTTLSNATSTNFFATTASSTNLFAQLANLGSTTVQSLTVGSGISSSGAFSVNGSGYFSGGLGVGVATTSAGVLQTSGNAWIGGNLLVVGNSTTLGASTADTLAVNSSITSHLIPNQNITYDLGSGSFYWRNVYVGNIVANNISAASTTIAGTASQSFTINSDNLTSDTEDMDLIFFRGNVVPNALISWKTAAKRFELNQSTYISNLSGSTTQPTLRLQGVPGQTGNLFEIASSTGTTMFSVDATGATLATGFVSQASSTVVGDFTVTGNSNFTGTLGLGTTTLKNLVVANTSTSTFAGPVTFGSNLLNIISTGQVVLGAATANASALFQLDSTTRGFLPPRMSTAQKNAISSPSSGLVTYDSTLNKLNVFNGTVWKNVGSTELDGEVTSGTAGSVLFVDNGSLTPVLQQDNANFSFASTTHTLSLANLSLTSGTSTSFFATTASSTNLYAQSATLGATSLLGVLTMNNNVSDTKIQLRRIGGDNISLEHDSQGFFIWNQLTSSVMANFRDSSFNGDVLFGYHGSNSLGKVGVGTSTPWGKISASTTTAAPGLVVQQFGAGPAAVFFGNVGISSTSPYARFSVRGNSVGTAATIQATNSGDSPIFTLLDNGTFTFSGISGSATSSIGGAVNIGANFSSANYLDATPHFVASISGSSLSSDTLTLTNAGVANPGAGINFHAGFVGSDSRLLNAGHIVSGYASVASPVGYANNFITLGTANSASTYRDELTLRGGNVGVGSTTPWAKLSVSAQNGETNTALFVVSSSTASATSTHFIVNNIGNVGVGTTTPWGRLAVTAADNSSTNQFVVASSTAIAFSIANTGAVTMSNNLLCATDGGCVWGPTGNRPSAVQVTDFVGASRVIFNAGRFVGGTNAIALTDSAQTQSGTLSFGGNGLESTSPGLYGTSTSLTLNLANGALGGRFGIGTSSPYAKLAVNLNSADNIPAFVIASSTASATTTLFTVGNTGNVFALGNVGVGSSTPWAKLSVKGAGTTTGVNFQTTNSSDAPLFTILDSGSVGVGTSSPSQSFSVANAAYFASNLSIGDAVASNNVALSIGTSTDSRMLHFRSSLNGNKITFNNGGPTNYMALGVFVTGTNTRLGFGYTPTGGSSQTEVLSVVDSGSVGVSTSTPWGRLAVSAADNASGHQFIVASSTAVSFLVNKSGFVGIGTSSPQALLGMQGAIGVNSSQFYLAADGKVGIGTTSPQATLGMQGGIGVNSTQLYLAANGSVGVNSATTNARMSIDGNGANTGYGQLALSNTAFSAGIAVMGIESATNSIVGGGTTGDFSIASPASLLLSASNGGTVKMINASTAQLQLSGWADLDTDSRSGALFVGNTAAFRGILEYGAAGNSILSLDNTYDSTSAVTQFRMRTYGNSTTTVMTLMGSGKVGIGTTTPWAKLSVNQFNGGTAPLFVVASSTGSSATSTAFMINYQGHVGIGTTTPGMLNGTAGRYLSLEGSDAALTLNATNALGKQYGLLSTFDTSPFFSIWDASSSTHRFVVRTNGNTGIGTSTPSGNLVVNGTTGQNLFQIATSTNQNIFIVDKFGNLAVGTSTPLFATWNSRLSVQGGSAADTRVANFVTDTTSNSNGYAAVNIDTQSITSNTATTYAFNIDTQAGANSFYVSNAGSARANSMSILGPSALTTAGFSVTSQNTSAGVGTSFITFDTSSQVSNVSVSKLLNAATAADPYQFVIHNNGNIGVGTTTPTAKLSVVGTNNSSANLFSVNSQSSGATTTRFLIDSAGAATFSSTLSSGTTTLTNLIVTNLSTSTFAGSLAVKTTGLVFDGSSNNVGIGTAAPTSRLSIVGAGTSNPVLQLSTGSGSNNRSFRYIIGGSGADYDALVLQGNTATGGTTFADLVSVSADGIMGVGYTPLVGGVGKFLVNGRVGIGTTTPNNSLDVFGFANVNGIAGGYKIDNTLILQASSTRTSLFLGSGAGNTSYTAPANVGIGTNALTALTTGNSLGGLIAIGSNALASATSSFYDIAIGMNAMQYQTTGAVSGDANAGQSSVAIGWEALKGVSGQSFGVRNVAIGERALRLNTTGSRNNAMGYGALAANTTGADNIAVGSALTANTVGAANIVLGTNAMISATSSSGNTALGYEALRYFTGSQSGSAFEYNTAVGYQAVAGDTGGMKGVLNTGVGQRTLAVLTTGGANSAFGYRAGAGVTTGSQNVIIGYLNAGTLTTGSYNTIIGSAFNNNAVVDTPASGTNNFLNIMNMLYGVNTAAGGTVGIGTTTPWGVLSASSTSTTIPALVAEQKSTGPAALFLGGAVGVGTTTPWGRLAVSVADNVSTNQFIVASSTAISFQINNAGQALLSDGTAGYPSISFAGQTNLGFFRPSSGILSAVVGGASAFDVYSGGTAVPVGKSYNFNSAGAQSTVDALISRTGSGAIAISANTGGAGAISIGGTTSAFPMIKRNGAGLDFRLADDTGYATTTGQGGLFNGMVGVGSTTPWGMLSASSTSATIPALAVQQNGAGAAAIFSGGNVGIGSTTPSDKLSISGNESNVALNLAFGVNRYLRILSQSAQTSFFSNSAVEYMRFDANAVATVLMPSTGNVGVGSTTPWAKLSVKGNGTTTGVNFQTTNSSDAQLFSVLDSGQVGVGTTTSGSMMTISSSQTLGLHLYGAGGVARMDFNALQGGGQRYQLQSSVTAGRLGNFEIQNFTSGAVPFAITSNNDVGIASTTPWARLAIQATDNLTTNQFVVASSTAVSFLVNKSGFVGVGTTTPWAKLAVGVSDNLATNQFAVASSTAVSLVVDKSGYVGIGTATANAPLHLYSSPQAVSVFAGTGGTALNAMAVFTGGAGSSMTNYGRVAITPDTTYGTTELFFANGAPGANSFVGYGSGIRHYGAPAGSADNAGLSLFTSYGTVSEQNVDRLTITHGGLVGIGTTSPNSLLEISGSNTGTTLATFTATTTLAITNRDTTTNNFETLAFRTQDATNGAATSSAQIAGVNTAHTAGASSGALSFLTLNGGSLSEKMRITAAGSVGIGTTTPGSIFSVQGVGNFVANGTSTITSTGGGIDLSTGCFSVRGACLSGPTGTAGQLAYFSDVNNAVGTSTLFITTATNVGIGTTSPQAKLDIVKTSAGATADVLAISNLSSATSTASRLSFRTGDITNNVGTTTAAITSLLTQNFNTGKGELVFSTLNSGTLTEGMRLTSTGLLGIGTTTPTYKLSVANAASAPQFSLAYDSGHWTTQQVDASGNWTQTSTGGYNIFSNDNVEICANGSCPTTTATSTAGNLFVENAVVIGDGFSLREIDGTQLGLYNVGGSLMVTFDNGN